MSDIVSGMEIPSNSEICLVLADLIKIVEKQSWGSESRLQRAREVLDGLMSGVDSSVPPQWVPIETCPKCGGMFFIAQFSHGTHFEVCPRAISFRTTAASNYDRTLNIEFNNMRVSVGSGATVRRWFKHEVVCSKPIEDVEELLKPIWLASYRAVDKNVSIQNLKEILE